jgi:hypothetical protein
LSTDIETLQWQAGARKSTSDLNYLRFEFAVVEWGQCVLPVLVPGLWIPKSC